MTSKHKCKVIHHSKNEPTQNMQNQVLPLETQHFPGSKHTPLGHHLVRADDMRAPWKCENNIFDLEQLQLQNSTCRSVRPGDLHTRSTITTATSRKHWKANLLFFVAFRPDPMYKYLGGRQAPLLTLSGGRAPEKTTTGVKHARRASFWPRVVPAAFCRVWVASRRHQGRPGSRYPENPHIYIYFFENFG